MDQNTSSSYGIKTQLSLASLMFFGPFIKHFLNENEAFELTESDKIFVKWYMILGGINLVLGILVTIIWILSKFFEYQIFNILFIVFSAVLLFALIAGSIGVFANISITTSKNSKLTDNISQDLTNNNAIRDYIPFLNLYTWYTLHDFDGNHDTIKESLLARTIFGLVCFTGNIWIISIALIIIIIRIVILSVIWDTMPQRRHTTINTLFHKNIEEVWWWCMGWLIGHVGNLFGHSVVISTKQKEQQLAYSYLYDIRKYGSIQWQYLILLLISGYVLYTSSTVESFEFILLGMIILWWRYIMMGIIWNHLPPLPIIHDLFRGITVLFEKKLPINKK